MPNKIRIFTLATKFVFFIFPFVFWHFCFYFISYPWKVLSMFKYFLRDVFFHWSVYLIFSKFQIVLTSESEYLSFISFSNLSKSWQFAYSSS
jgi:hypothetical protein